MPTPALVDPRMLRLGLDAIDRPGRSAFSFALRYPEIYRARKNNSRRAETISTHNRRPEKILKDSAPAGDLANVIALKKFGWQEGIKIRRYQISYVQRTYSIDGRLRRPVFRGGISITREPVPSRFALSRSPAGTKTIFASLGTSICPMVRNAFRANSFEPRHFSENFSSAMIFFITAK